MPGLKLGWATWIEWITSCVGQSGQTRIMKIFKSDPDLALTALLECFNLFGLCSNTAALLTYFLSFR